MSYLLFSSIFVCASYEERNPAWDETNLFILIYFSSCCWLFIEQKQPFSRLRYQIQNMNEMSNSLAVAADCETALNIGATQINRHLGSIVSSRAFITHCLSSQSVGNWVRSVLMMKWVSCIPLLCALSVYYARGLGGKPYIAHLSLFTAPSCRCMHKLCACRTPAKSIEPRADEIYW